MQTGFCIEFPNGSIISVYLYSLRYFVFGVWLTQNGTHGAQNYNFIAVTKVKQLMEQHIMLAYNLTWEGLAYLVENARN